MTQITTYFLLLAYYYSIVLEIITKESVEGSGVQPYYYHNRADIVIQSALDELDYCLIRQYILLLLRFRLKIFANIYQFTYHTNSF